MTNTIKTETSIYNQVYFPAINGLKHLFLLAIRITWGWRLFQTGKGKLGDINSVTQYFTELHIPLPKLNAILAGSTECFGGLLLVLGLGSRLISLPVTITMLVAYIAADREALKSVDKFVAATPFPFLMMSLIVLFFGAGFFSVDKLLERCGCCAGKSEKQLS